MVQGTPSLKLQISKEHSERQGAAPKALTEAESADRPCFVIIKLLSSVVICFTFKVLIFASPFKSHDLSFSLWGLLKVLANQTDVKKLQSLVPYVK